MHWQTTRFRIDLDAPARDGHRQRHARFVLRRRPATSTPARALAHCERLLRRGRRHPRHRRRIDAARARRRCRWTKSCARVLPVLRGAVRAAACRSRSTRYKPEVMRAALDRGRRHRSTTSGRCGSRARSRPWPRMRRCGVCLMHMQGEPQTMQRAPHVRRRRAPRCATSCASASQALRRRGHRARAHRRRSRASASARRSSITSRCCARQRELLRARLSAAGRLVAQVVAGRRHRAAGRTSGWPASVAAALLAVERGARIVRVHDVAETVGRAEGAGARCRQRQSNQEQGTSHEQKIFRHRRHPRHGRRSRRSRRTSCCASAMPSAGCCKTHRGAARRC